MARRVSIDRTKMGAIDVIGGAGDNPNALVLAPVPPAGSVYQADDGTVWVNLDGTNTGWILTVGGRTISGEFPMGGLIPVSVGGSYSAVARANDLDTGAVLGQTGIAVTTTATGFSQGKARDVIAWGKPHHWRCELSMLAHTANGVARIIIGDPGVVPANPAAPAIGIRIDDLAVKGLAFGAALQTVDLATNLVALQTTIIDIQSDGDGNVKWFINGVAKGNTALGPNADGAAGDSRVTVSVANNADAANQTMTIHQIWYDIAA